MGKTEKCSECKLLATVKVLERTVLDETEFVIEKHQLIKHQKNFAKDRMILTRSCLTCCACRGGFIRVCTAHSCRHLSTMEKMCPGGYFCEQNDTLKIQWLLGCMQRVGLQAALSHVLSSCVWPRQLSATTLSAIT